jgi:diaminopimelate epimerase
MIPFLKMHGLGNDFVVLDAREKPIAVDSALAANIANRKTGIGCDQIVLLESSILLRQVASGDAAQSPPQAGERVKRADVRMRIFNADGSEVETCGNAARCVAWYEVAEKRHGPSLREQTIGPSSETKDGSPYNFAARNSGDDELRIETSAGIITAQIVGDHLVTVDMGPPRFGWKDIPLAKEMDTQHITLHEGELRDPAAVSMGNPHLVFFVENIAAVPVKVVGPRLETHPLFPQRTNVEFAQIENKSRIRLRVWERGVGETEACGSGACATLVAAARRGLTGRKATVALPGGELIIEWQADSDNRSGSVLMTGPVAVSFRGEVEI